MAEGTHDVIVDPFGRDAAVPTAIHLHGGWQVGRRVDGLGRRSRDPGLSARRPSRHGVADNDLYVHALTAVMSKPENFTVRMGEELKRRMKDHPEINWSHVIREHVRSVLDDVDRMDRLASGSDLTEEDVEALSAVIDAAAADRVRSDLESRGGGGGERDEERVDRESRPNRDVTDADAT